MPPRPIHIHIRVTPSAVRWACLAVLGLVAVAELGTESFTLSTYYPAPSGVYNRLITTNATFLARDSGNVGVGTTSPSNRLEVNIGSAAQDGVRVSGAGAWGPFLLLNNAVAGGSPWYILSGGGQDGNSPLGGLSFHRGGVGTKMTIAPSGNVRVSGTVNASAFTGKMDVIFCEQSGPSPGGASHTFTFSAAQCGGTLPNSNYIGAANRIYIDCGFNNFKILAPSDAGFPGISTWNSSRNCGVYDMAVLYIRSQ